QSLVHEPSHGADPRRIEGEHAPCTAGCRLPEGTILCDEPSGEEAEDPPGFLPTSRKIMAAGDQHKGKQHPITIVAAILANLAIAMAKFFAAAVSSSAALFAEGVHSLVDTANDVLLLFGHHR